MLFGKISFAGAVALTVYFSNLNLLLSFYFYICVCIYSFFSIYCFLYIYIIIVQAVNGPWIKSKYIIGNETFGKKTGSAHFNGGLNEKKSNMKH